MNDQTAAKTITQQSLNILRALSTLPDIQTETEKAIERRSSVVILVTVRDSAPQTETVLLCKGHGPRGELLQAMQNDTSDKKWRIVARYPAQSVLKFCKRMRKELLK